MWICEDDILLLCPNMYKVLKFSSVRFAPFFDSKFLLRMPWIAMIIVTVIIVVGIMTNIIIAILFSVNNKVYMLLCSHFQNSCSPNLWRHNGWEFEDAQIPLQRYFKVSHGENLPPSWFDSSLGKAGFNRSRQRKPKLPETYIKWHKLGRTGCTHWSVQQ